MEGNAGCLSVALGGKDARQQAKTKRLLLLFLFLLVGTGMLAKHTGIKEGHVGRGRDPGCGWVEKRRMKAAVGRGEGGEATNPEQWKKIKGSLWPSRHLLRCRR